MPDTHHTEVVEVVDRPVSVSYIARTLRAYWPVIALVTVAVGLGYIVLAVAAYQFSHTQRITTQQFRLEFEGASDARYPNGLKFAASDITSTPVLLKVFQTDDLGRYISFADFSRGIVVLESNLDYERLAADYQARLADPKLSPIDRDRLQREWQDKAAALSKNDYSINWMWTRKSSKIPESLAQKVLADVLSTWARYAVNEQHVLQYRLAALSPQVINNPDAEVVSEPIIAIQVLRAQIFQVAVNVDNLRTLPGAELLRSSGGMTLEEIRLRLEELVRFGLDPLFARAAASGQNVNRSGTLRFLESQLAYDRRQLKSAQEKAESIRQALAVYTMGQHAPALEGESTAQAPTRDTTRSTQSRADNVVPQLSDSFIDRMVTLTSQANDAPFRQGLVSDYRRAAQAVIPAEESVSYDEDALNLVKSNTSTGTMEASEVRAKITATQEQARRLIVQINQVATAISASLNPSKELYTVLAPPASRSESSHSLKQFLLYGIALVSMAFAATVALSFLHARIRKEDEEGTALHQAESAAV